ncbi:acyl carrier protein [Kitasatospora sp. NPDC006697]|uniref:acyl carrier protein n=1 Tax=Kitasatospora sp. NPDC006697 TaxID=3364020 RepID=UPI00367DBA00
MRDIPAAVRTTLQDVLELPSGDLPGNTLLFTLPNADSLHLLQVVVRLEEAFGSAFDDEDLARLQTVQDLVDAVGRAAR